MTFLNPLVLLGLAAAGIPLIIHLFNFRRPRRIDFSSLAFVRELEQTTMRRVRIKQWLLLLMRTLALAALVLAFARPTLTGNLAQIVGGNAKAAVGILVDNSRSMEVRDSQGSVLTQALDAANAIIENTGDGDEIMVLTTAGPTSAQPVSFRSRDGAREYVADIRAADGARSIGDATKNLAESVTGSALLNKEIYLVTDAQISTLGDSLRVEAPEAVQYRLVKLNDRPADNVGITNVEVISRIVELGQPVRLSADIANYAERDVRSYVASVFLENQRVAQATVDIPANSVVRADFTATAPARGWLRGVVRGESDDFESDDERHFTLHVPRERSLLIVRGEGQSTEYVSLALSPTLAREGVFFSTRTISEVDLPAERIDGYDAIVLVGLNTISSGEVATLSQYVEQGGGLLIFPSSETDFSDYDQLLGALGGGRIVGTIGSLGGSATGAAGSDAAVASLAEVELEHPLFDGVFDEESLRRGRGVEQLAVYFAAAYQPSTGTEQTLITLSSGNPFMQELRHGAGATLWMSVAPDPSWSELPVRGLFVPLLYRAVFYLSAGEQAGGDQLIVGRPAEIRLSGVPRGAGLALRGPDGEVFVPEQRNLFGAVLLQTDEQITRAGVYDVVATEAGTPSDDELDGETLRRVAFNLSPAESDLSLYDTGEATDRLSTSLGRPVDAISGRDPDFGDLGRAIQEARTGSELWNVFLLVALLFLAVEMLIEKHWRPEASR